MGPALRMGRALIVGTALIWGSTAVGASPAPTTPPDLGPGAAPDTATMPYTPDTTVEQSLDFTAHYGRDTPLGHHRVTVAKAANGDTVVDVDISFEAKLLMITAYRYHHTSHEVWHDGRLKSLESSTHDNGDTDWVKGHAVADGFAVESSRGTVMAPADILPTSYWNPSTPQATRLLDTIRGVVMDVKVDRKGTETIQAGNGTVTATHYSLGFVTNPPPATSRVDFWYDDSGHWLKLAFHARGHDVAYALQGTPPGSALVAAPAGTTTMPAPER
ncbi:DUF6134 family protein [Nitrospirillum iridis]|uniref:DUF3108 domain-containing protein n=1 Tax=Nitrospirillum iridis TaxID=765888 RepID=A0A7X0B3W8_9PROT|nr:DUF6134 family protein [Nitrospirillum iridis]MBB6253956.1 hypothetical protein [Nitrospirillum iridis]